MGSESPQVTKLRLDIELVQRQIGQLDREERRSRSAFSVLASVGKASATVVALATVLVGSLSYRATVDRTGDVRFQQLTTTLGNSPDEREAIITLSELSRRFDDSQHALAVAFSTMIYALHSSRVMRTRPNR